MSEPRGRYASAALGLAEVVVQFGAAGRWGGVERVLWELLAAAGGRRVCFAGGAFGGLPGVEYEVLPVRDSRSARGLMRNWRVFREAQRRVAGRLVVTGGVTCPPGDVLIVGSVHRAWVSGNSNVRIRGINVDGRLRALHPWHRTVLELERRYFSSARFEIAVACSERVAEDLQRWYGIADRRLAVVPNGVNDVDFSFQSRVACRGAGRRSIGAEGQVVVLFVANELHRKGFETVLRSVASLGRHDVRIDVVGRAAPTAYAPLIRQLGLERSVHYWGPTPEVAPYFAAADVLVLPTQYEPFGLVIVEALAMGTPVITSKCAGAADAIEHGRTGLVIDDPHDVAGYAAAIAAVADGRLAPLSAADVEAIHARFEWRAITKQLWDLIDDVSEQRAWRLAGQRGTSAGRVR